MSRRRMDSCAEITTDAIVSRYNTVIEWLLIALLAFMPLAFGAVEAWSELVVIGLAGAMAVCLAMKLLPGRKVNVVWTSAYALGLLFILLVALQLLPLPAGLIKIISPNTAATKAALLSDLPNADAALRSMTLSFYPLATRHDLRLIIVAAIVFVVVINVYRRPDQIKRLLAAITIIGAGIALLALAQIISGTDKIYWRVPTGHGLADAGTFINHSHYGQFMNLSIGAALGLLLVKLHEHFHEREATVPAIIERLGERDLRVVWYLIGMIILAVATIFLSLTRGGMISLLIAGSVTALILATKRSLKGRGWIMSLMALGAFVCVLYVGFDAVYDRLATMREQHQYEGRWQIVEDIAVAWTKFPALGTGLGTHEVVYPMFDRSTIPSLASHAENEYAQAAEETGIIGLGLLVGFIAIVWKSYFRNVRRTHLPIRSAAFGLGFGLLAVMIHSFSDFGQHLPANACLSAVACGLILGLARMGGGEANTPARTKGVGSSTKVRAAVAVIVTGVVVWSVIGARDAYSAETHWRQALRIEETLRENDWLGTNDEYTRLLSHAEQASLHQPENVKYRHWLNVYRWRSISRVTDPNTGQVAVTPQILEFTERIVGELHQARRLCPTFGAIYCVAGQLEKFVLDDPAGAGHIRTGFRLAPCDATACFVAGLLDTQEEKFEDSLAKFRRAVTLNGSMIRDVVAIYVHQVNRPDLAVTLAQDNLSWLSLVARALGETSEHPELADRVRSEVARLLKEKCSQPDAPAASLASLAYIYRKEKDYAAAADYFRRALSLDYGQVNWRLALARTLAKIDQVREAIHEARICMRLRPQMAAAKRLIEDLSVHPDAIQDGN